MPSLSKSEADTIRELITKGRALVRSAQIIRVTQDRSIMRTDLAMRQFIAALTAAEQISKLDTKPDVDAQ